MFFLEVYFALTLIVFLITIPFYISRVRVYRSVKCQYFLIILLIFMYTIFFINFSELISEHIGDSSKVIYLSSLSHLFLFLSVYLLGKSFYLYEDIVILKHPSRFKSRRGTILLGKVLKNDRKSLIFYLLKF